MTSRLVLAANALQTLHRTVSGVTAPAVSAYPTVIDTPDLPFVMAWPGAGNTYQKGGGYRTDERTFEVFCYVQAVGQDDVPSRAVDAMGALSDITDLYITPANTSLMDPEDADSEGYQMTIESGVDTYQVPDTGVMFPLQFGGRQFIGFKVSVRVRILWVP